MHHSQSQSAINLHFALGSPFPIHFTSKTFYNILNVQKREEKDFIFNELPLHNFKKSTLSKCEDNVSLFDVSLDILGWLVRFQNDSHLDLSMINYLEKISAAKCLHFIHIFGVNVFFLFLNSSFAIKLWRCINFKFDIMFAIGKNF